MQSASRVLFLPVLVETENGLGISDMPLAPLYMLVGPYYCGLLLTASAIAFATALIALLVSLKL